MKRFSVQPLFLLILFVFSSLASVAQQVTQYDGTVMYGWVGRIDSAGFEFKQYHQKETKTIPATVARYMIYPHPYVQWYCSIKLPGTKDTIIMRCDRFGQIKLVGRYALPNMLVPGMYGLSVWNKHFDVYIQKGDSAFHTLMTGMTGNRWVVSAQTLTKDQELFLKSLIADIPELAQKYENVHAIDYRLLLRIIDKYNSAYLKISGRKDAYSF